MIKKILAVNAFTNAKEKLGSIGTKTGLGTVQKGDAGFFSTLILLTNILLSVVGIVASIYIIYAGIKWIIAGGNEDEVKQAKQTIRAAVWGLLIVFSAFIIVNFVVEQLVNAVTN